MDEATRTYFERREQMEREAANRALSPEARRAHEEMAKAYLAAINVPEAEKAGRPRLSIVVKPQ